MLTLYTGTPGSGKSYHATQRIDIWLRQGRNVICTYPIKLDNKRHKGLFLYIPLLDLSVDCLLQFASDNHKPKKESQTLVIIDEAHILFNTRGYNVKERIKWLQFLALSRHYGYDFILITQNDRAIDRQVRGLIEFNVKHRKLTSFGVKGWLLVVLFRKRFISIRYWYVNNEKCDHEFFNITRRIASLYDTFAMFDDVSCSDLAKLPYSGSKLVSPSEFNKKRNRGV